MACPPKEVGPDDILSLQKDAKMLRMLCSVGIAIMPGFGAGMALAITSPSLAHYKDVQVTPLPSPMTEEQGSWFVTVVLVFIVVGTLTSGYLSESFGRKKTLMISVVILLLGWISLFFANTFPFLLLSRCVSGIGIGVTMPSAYMLLSELALLRLRGALGVCNILIGNVAFLLSLILASSLPFHWILPISATPCFVFFAFVYFLPESPLWYIKQNRVGEAEGTLVWLRGKQYPIMAEMKDLLYAASQQTSEISLMEKIKYLRSTQVIKPLLIMFGLFTLEASCGADLITFYSLDIIDKAGLAINPYFLSCLIQGGFLVGNMMSTPFMSKIGRRPQFLFSTLLVAICTLTIGVCMFVGSSESAYYKVVQILAPAASILSTLSYSLGLGPVLFALVAEVYPARVKGLCCSLTLSFRYMMVGVNMKFFPTMYNWVGLSGVFLFCGSMSLLNIVFGMLLMPETQGLSLTELSMLFSAVVEEEKEPEKVEDIPKDKVVFTIS